MSVFNQLYRAETTFDFVGNRRRGFILSGILLSISLIALLTLGLNLSVDFEGGTVAEAENVAGADVADIRDSLRGLGLDNAKVQLLGGGSSIRVETEELDEGETAELVAAVAEVAGVPPDDVSVESVGPSFGAEIARSSVRALIVFLIVVTIFISLRFEWKMALAAMAALGHDLVLTAGVYAITQFEVTPATVIGILTILGYSLYDTVVVFDKVKETVTLAEDRYGYGEVVNASMNEVLMRSINTSLTSLLPIGSLLFVGSFLLGAATLREFALALFVGVAAGTYSSIFIAAPLLAGWKAGEEEWVEAAARSERIHRGDHFITAQEIRVEAERLERTRPKKRDSEVERPSPERRAAQPQRKEKKPARKPERQPVKKSTKAKDPAKDPASGEAQERTEAETPPEPKPQAPPKAPVARAPKRKRKRR